MIHLVNATDGKRVKKGRQTPEDTAQRSWLTDSDRGSSGMARNGAFQVVAGGFNHGPQ